jgi:hypothetical protein
MSNDDILKTPVVTDVIIGVADWIEDDGDGPLIPGIEIRYTDSTRDHENREEDSVLLALFTTPLALVNIIEQCEAVLNEHFAEEKEEEE